MKHKLTYVMVVLNRLEEMQTAIRRVSPYVTRTCVVDGGRFPAGTKVLTPKGPVNIEDLSVGDVIFGKSGQEQKVKNTFVKDYQGDFIKVKPNKMLPVDMTSNHPILVIEGQKCGTPSRRAQNINCKPWCSCGYWREKEPVWKRADEVSVGDYVLVPREFNYDKRQDVDEDLAELLGWYLAEGHISNRTVVFSLSSDEMVEAERISYLMSTVFDLKPHYLKERNKKGLRVSFHSVKLCRVFEYFFGNKKSRHKRVPNDIFCAPSKVIRSFLVAYNKGDGSTHKCVSKGYYNFVLNTSSEELLYDLQQLFYYFGIVPSFSEQKDVENRYSNNSIYKATLNKNDTLKMLGGSVNKPYLGRSFMYKGFVCTPVREVTVAKENCKVYNIETEDNTYISSFVVHNSNDGSIEWLQSNECKKMNVEVKVSKQFRYAIGNHTPRERDQYLRMAGHDGWLIYTDSDEFLDEEACKNFDGLISAAEKNNCDLISFQAHDVWSYEDGRVYDNVSDYRNPMMWKGYPGQHYVGHTHGSIARPGATNRVMQSGFEYQHTKSERMMWQNSTFLYWTTAENAQNNTNDWGWIKFHNLMQKYGHYDWHELHKAVVKGWLPQEIKDWFIQHKDVENPEMRAWFVDYFIFRHPNENVDKVGNKDMEWDYVSKSRAKLGVI